MKRLFGSLAMIASAFTLIAAVPSDGQVLRKKAVPVVIVKTETLPQPAAQVEATARKTGVVFNAVIRSKLRQEFRKQGLGLVESIRKANQATDDVIAGLVDDAEKISGVQVVGTAIGDGKFLDAIFEWFKSPQGQAFLDALLKLLLGLLLVHDSPEGHWHSSLAAWNA